MKILMIATLLMMSFMSSCLAVDLEDSRWFRIYDVGTDKYYVDLQTMEFGSESRSVFRCNNQHRYISVWAYSELASFKDYKYTLSFVHWDLDCKKFKFDEIIAFKEDGTQHGRQDCTLTKPFRVTPGSKSEYEMQILNNLWKEYGNQDRE